MTGDVVSVRDWLNQLIEHEGDERWLNAHEEALLEAVQEGIHINPAFHDAVEIFIRSFHYFGLVLYHIEEWSKPLMDVLLEAQYLNDNEMQINIFNRIGESNLTKGKNTAAHDAFEIALRRAQEHEFQEMRVAAYMGLIRLQSVNLSDKYDPQLIEQALVLNKQIRDLSLKAGLHQAITLAHINARRIPEAIGHGQTAYVYWKRLENSVEVAKTAYLLSAALRMAEQMDYAQQWLSIASAQFEKTNYNRQYTLVAYEQGVLHLVRDEYEEAEQWLTVALEEAIQVNSTYEVASTYHALGITHSVLKKFRSAEQNLRAALKLWDELGDVYELANCYYAIAYLEKQRGNDITSDEWRNKALIKCGEIPDEVQRAWLEKRIRDDLDEN